MPAKVTLLGVPSDVNSSFLRGPARAPAAIRAHLASGVSNLFAEDGTDLSAPGLFADAGNVAIAETPADLDAIADAAGAIFRQGAGLFLGGDHFVSWPLLEGLRRAGRAPPHIVHVDAHPDLYPDFEGNEHSHASPFARIMERRLAASLTQIGVRTVNDVQQAQIAHYGVRTFAPRRFAEALAALPAGPTYLSIDLDGLDPAFAPGVSHHEPGGLSTRELLELIDALPGPLIGADIVELNPDRDINAMTAALAAKLVKELAARMVRDSGEVELPLARAATAGSSPLG
jgi:agmatinase